MRLAAFVKGKAPGDDQSQKIRGEVRVALVRSALNSTGTLSGRHVTTEHKIMRKGLELKVTDIKFLRHVTAQKRSLFPSRPEDDELFTGKLAFNDETTLHYSGKVNRLSRLFEAAKILMTSQILMRDSAKLKVFRALTKQKLFGPFFFMDCHSVSRHARNITHAQF
jgi:hypothetical protein